jgi:dihydrofolate reductase
MKLILACDRNGGIGYKNRLPWDNIQGDLSRFKKLTKDHTVIMGRNTWDSLPKKPLLHRTNIVVSSRPLEKEYENVIRVPDLTFNRSNCDDFWLIGGAKLVDSLWGEITEVHLTKVLTQYNCDTFIDLVKLEKDFQMISSENFSAHQYQIWRRNT